MPYDRVLVALDVVSEKASGTVAQRAVQFAPGADLTVVYVFDEDYLYLTGAVALRGVPEFRE